MTAEQNRIIYDEAKQLLCSECEYNPCKCVRNQEECEHLKRHIPYVIEGYKMAMRDLMPPDLEKELIDSRLERAKRTGTDLGVVIIGDGYGTKELVSFSKELVSFSNREALQRLEEIDRSIDLIPEGNYHNMQKQESQQGWKKRPKHKR